MGKIAFLFPGQGSQKVGMGKSFYDNFTLAKEIFSRADEVLGFKISSLCFEGPGEKLKLTEFTQPALLTVSYIAFRLLGHKPDIAAGHSLGEYSALVASGAISFEDALVLVNKRGKFMQEAVPVGVGSMAALLGVRKDKVQKVLEGVKEGIVEIANWNSEEQIVIAGEKKAVEIAVNLINAPRSVFLQVSAPFHCSLMKPAEEKLSAELDKTEFKNLSFPIVTNVDAKVISKKEEAKNSLKKQVSRAVLWYKSMVVLKDFGCTHFIELGTGRVLSNLLKRISKKWDEEITILNVEDKESLEKARALISSLSK